MARDWRPSRSACLPRPPPCRANRQQGRQRLDADLDCAGAVDDHPGPGAVLWRPRAFQEHALGADAGFYTVCIVIIIWALYGYSLAFTGGSDFIGGFSKAFLMGVTPDSKASTFSVDANISELVYVCFQMTFAAITPRPHRRRLCRAHEILGRRAVHPALGHA